MNVYTLKVFKFNAHGYYCAYFEGNVEVKHLSRYQRPETFDARVSLSRNGESCMHRLNQLHVHTCLPLFSTEHDRDEYIERVTHDVQVACKSQGWDSA